MPAVLAVHACALSLPSPFFAAWVCLVVLEVLGVRSRLLSEHFRVDFGDRHDMSRERTDARVFNSLVLPWRALADLRRRHALSPPRQDGELAWVAAFESACAPRTPGRTAGDVARWAHHTAAPSAAGWHGWCSWKAP